MVHHRLFQYRGRGVVVAYDIWDVVGRFESDVFYHRGVGWPRKSKLDILASVVWRVDGSRMKVFPVRCIDGWMNEYCAEQQC